MSDKQSAMDAFNDHIQAKINGLKKSLEDYVSSASLLSEVLEFLNSLDNTDIDFLSSRVQLSERVQSQLTFLLQQRNEILRQIRSYQYMLDHPVQI